MKSAVFIKIGGWSDICLINFMGRAVKEKFPNVTTTLVLGKSLSDWTPCLSFDHVILIDDKKFLRRLNPSTALLRLILKLRSRTFDVGFNLHRYKAFDKALKWGGIKNIFSLASVKDQRSDIEQYLELLAQIEVVPVKLNFRINVRKHVHEEMMRRLASLELRSKNFLVIAPGGGENALRPFHNVRWNHYAELISLFCKRTQYPVLLVGNDRELSLKLTALNPTRVKSLVGEIDREQTAAIIAESLAFVGNDSGPSHVAGSIGVPSVVLFGPTSSRKRQPPGKDSSVICIDGFVPCSPCAKNDEKTLGPNFDWNCRDNACMKSISPEEAWAALARISNLVVPGSFSL